MNSITIIIIVAIGTLLSIGGSFFISRHERKKIVESGKTIGKSEGNRENSQDTISKAEKQIENNEEIINSARSAIKNAEKIREKALDASSNE